MYKVLATIKTVWTDGYIVNILLVKTTYNGVDNLLWKLEGSTQLFSSTDSLMEYYKGTVKSYELISGWNIYFVTPIAISFNACIMDSIRGNKA